MDLKTLNLALDQISEDKGISKEKIIETLEQALAAAYKKDYGQRGQIIRAKFDPETGDIQFSQIKLVVDESMLKPEEPSEETSELPGKEPLVSDKQPAASDSTEYEPAQNLSDIEAGGGKKVRFNPERHIMIDEAKKIKRGIKLGEEVVFGLKTEKDYGRIAAQTAKQVILQRIREAEREAIYEEFKKLEGEITSGIVQRVEDKLVFIDLGRAVGLLPPEEQIRGERYRIGERVKILLLHVEQRPRSTSILLSRSHPQFVYQLFAIEIPEITNGVVEIKALAREAGSRTKIAVTSNQENIDPVGSCVGQKGVRVNTIISELGGEKIDIVEWTPNAEEFIAHALSPAKILDVELNEEKKEARVSVDENQLSLAIGKNGQNVRLAAKLTGWKIDIRSRSGESVASATDEGEVSGEKVKN